MKHAMLRLACLLPVVLLAGCFSRHPYLPTVDYVDLTKIEGDWFVSHHIPYWLEEGKLAPVDSYTLREDGKIDVEYRFREDSLEAEEESWEGYAWVVDPVTNAHWKIRFLWPFSTDFKIIDRDADYAWMVVGHPARDKLWILTRHLPLPETSLNGIKERAEQLGFDPKALKEIAHRQQHPKTANK